MWIPDGKRAVSDIDGTDVLYPSCPDAGVLRRGYYGKGKADLEGQSPRRSRHPLCDAGKVRGKRGDPEDCGGGQKKILYNYRTGESDAPGGIQAACYYDGGCRRAVGIMKKDNKMENKQYITVDNSYILFYTVYHKEADDEDYNQRFINGVNL